MFNWFSNNSKPRHSISLSEIRTDIHSHLIPGIDDGAPDMDTAITIIQKLSSLGLKKLVTTPHVMSDFYQNNSQNILEGLEKLKNNLIKKNISIEIEAAAEYYIDYEFEQKIGKEKFLTFGAKYLLVELSFISPVPNFREIIFKLQLEGYKVVLAHPERYNYYGLRDYKEITSRGVFLQVNLLSLIGYYSEKVKSKTSDLISKNLISFVGTDCHNISQAELYKKCQKEKLWHDLINSKKLINNTL